MDKKLSASGDVKSAIGNLNNSCMGFLLQYWTAQGTV